MNIASIFLLMWIAAAFVCAVRYTAKHGTCESCSGGCGGGGCASCHFCEEKKSASAAGEKTA